MANDILSTAAKVVTHTPQYQLDPQARRSILGQADSARTGAEIERQRIAFIANNFGCEFGQNNQPKHQK